MQTSTEATKTRIKAFITPPTEQISPKALQHRAAANHQNLAYLSGGQAEISLDNSDHRFFVIQPRVYQHDYTNGVCLCQKCESARGFDAQEGGAAWAAVKRAPRPSKPIYPELPPPDDQLFSLAWFFRKAAECEEISKHWKELNQRKTKNIPLIYGLINRECAAEAERDRAMARVVKEGQLLFAHQGTTVLLTQGGAA